MAVDVICEIEIARPRAEVDDLRENVGWCGAVVGGDADGGEREHAVGDERTERAAGNLSG